jgi:hypothetical protein
MGVLERIWRKRSHRGLMDALGKVERIAGEGVAGSAYRRGQRQRDPGEYDFRIHVRSAAHHDRDTSEGRHGDRQDGQREAGVAVASRGVRTERLAAAHRLCSGVSFQSVRALGWISQSVTSFQRSFDPAVSCSVRVSEISSCTKLLSCTSCSLLSAKLTRVEPRPRLSFRRHPAPHTRRCASLGAAASRRSSPRARSRGRRLRAPRARADRRASGGGGSAARRRPRSGPLRPAGA